MLFILVLISCSPLDVNYTHDVQTENETEGGNKEDLPCSISLQPQLEGIAAFVQVFASGVDQLKMELSLYDDQERLVRSLDLSASSTYELEMFWPMETPEHSWQDSYGTQARLIVQGTSDQGASCSGEYVDAFVPVDDRLFMYDLISNVQWERPNIEVLGLHVSVPPIHEPDKFALVSTPITHTLLRVLGPFAQDDGFVDIGNLALYETKQGKLLSMVTQEGWPGFEEQLFLRHNSITGTQEALLTLESTVHHTMSIKQQDDGSLDVLTSVWEEREEQNDSRSGYISFPANLRLDGDDLSVFPLVDTTEIYPDSRNNPLTYNNFVWPANPSGTMVGSVIFTNNATSLPLASENSSSVFLYDTQTQESWWFANTDNREQVHLYPERVVGLEAMSDAGLGIVFPHAVQFDGTRMYVQDHMDVYANGIPPRINAFDLDGTLLWSYVVPTAPDTGENDRRRHGGMWLLDLDGSVGVCSFFVDTQATYCADQDGVEVGVLRKERLSEHQGDKWQLVVYLENWKNTLSSSQ